MAAPVTSLTVSLEVNGEQIDYDVPTRRLLVHFIRDDLGLTGTHIGCDTGNCGACTVHVNGEAVKGFKLDQVSRRLLGAPGTTVALTLSREGAPKPLEYQLVRATVHVPARSQ